MALSTARIVFADWDNNIAAKRPTWRRHGGRCWKRCDRWSARA